MDLVSLYTCMHTYVCLDVYIFKEWRSSESWGGRSNVNAALTYRVVKEFILI